MLVELLSRTLERLQSGGAAAENQLLSAGAFPPELYP